jgi:uncharacterized protein YndB with AHSA1/START domain
MIEIIDQVNSVQRLVGSRLLDAGDARSVILSQTHASAAEDVWDACTNPGRLPRWFVPLTGELKVGGRYQFEGNAGGTIEVCDRPEVLSATWELGGTTTWIELQLTASDSGGTRFRLEHIALVDEQWTEYGPGGAGIGWDLVLLGLARYLESPDEHESGGPGWPGSQEGRRFIKESSARWCDADIAAGTDEARARAAAERVLAAYTPPQS